MPHLSYIGDTTVGEGSNVGAGTITANYDGVNKHATVVGSHVRTGSHNVFVAPVRIGDGAYTGAGTVVRKDVPRGVAGGERRSATEHRRLGRDSSPGQCRRGCRRVRSPGPESTD